MEVTPADAPPPAFVPPRSLHAHYEPAVPSTLPFFCGPAGSSVHTELLWRHSRRDVTPGNPGPPVSCLGLVKSPEPLNLTDLLEER